MKKTRTPATEGAARPREPKGISAAAKARARGLYDGFGARIASERKRAGYSQRDLAALVGISRQTLSTIEAGNGTPPDLLQICSIATLLAVDPVYLAFGRSPDDLPRDRDGLPAMRVEVPDDALMPLYPRGSAFYAVPADSYPPGSLVLGVLDSGERAVRRLRLQTTASREILACLDPLNANWPSTTFPEAELPERVLALVVEVRIPFAGHHLP